MNQVAPHSMAPVSLGHRGPRATQVHRVPKGTALLDHQGLLDHRDPLALATKGGKAPQALLAPLDHPLSQVPTDKQSASLAPLDHQALLGHQAPAGHPWGYVPCPRTRRC